MEGQKTISNAEKRWLVRELEAGRSFTTVTVAHSIVVQNM